MLVQKFYSLYVKISLIFFLLYIVAKNIADSFDL